jgi:GNAT superfamily N-acetyltransferase
MSTTRIDSEKITRALADLRLELQEEYSGLDLYVYFGQEDWIVVSWIIVPPDKRCEGIGTAVMRRLMDFADEHGVGIALTPDKTYGASSLGRLRKFYKGLGFKDNVGRTRDFSTRETMIYAPK